MRDAAEAVIKFNHELLGIAPRAIAPMINDEFEHLVKCFHEEFIDEFTKGQIEEDVVQQVDSIIDGMYFAIGGLYKLGLTADQIGACFMTVHEKNMLKRRGKVLKREVGDVPDAIKPENWVPPEVEIAKILGLSD